MLLPIEQLKDGDEFLFEDEDEFVVFDGTSPLKDEPDLVNVWVVGDKLPTRMPKGTLVETRRAVSPDTKD